MKVLKFKEYNIDITYSAITALAYYNLPYFDILNNPANKYNITTNEFWQGFLLAIKQEKRIQADKEQLMKLKYIDFNKDFNKIKKCVHNSKILIENFSDIPYIKCYDSTLEFNNIKIKPIISSVNITDITDMIGFTTKKIHYSEFYNNIITMIINDAKKETPYKDEFEELLRNKDISFSGIREPYSNIGIKISQMRRLYYNNIIDFLEDTTYSINFYNAIKEYKNSLLKDFIKENINRNINIVPIMKKYLGISDEYYSFTNDSLMKVDSDYLYSKCYGKILTNDNIDFIINDSKHEIRITFFSNVIPLEFKIKYKVI